MNVYPRMIEEIIHQCAYVREVAVVGELNERHGEIPVAYVAVDETIEDPERALKDHCRAHLGRHQIPKRFVILESLPKNATGKILKRELRKHGEVERGIVAKPE
jgi:long-chain acyl-CoA synthetase